MSAAASFSVLAGVETFVALAVSAAVGLLVIAASFGRLCYSLKSGPAKLLTVTVIFAWIIISDERLKFSVTNLYLLVCSVLELFLAVLF